MKYEVGDIVRVRKDLKAGDDFGNLYVTEDMAKLAGKLVTICDIEDDWYYHIVENDFLWIDNFFEDGKEEKSDEYEDIIDKVLSEINEETKDKLIKKLIKGKDKIAITASPIYKTMSYTNGISIQQIIGTKYSVTVTKKDGTVVL